MQLPALQRIEVENFRSLRNVAIDLGPVNVMVGPNGAGKSNVLDVIEFLGDSVRSDIVPAIQARGGYERVYFRGETSGPVRIRVEAHVTTYSSERATDEYSLTFRRSKLKRGWAIFRWETFKFKRFQGPGRRITINGGRGYVLDTDDKGRQAGQLSLGLRPDSLALSTLPKLSDDQGGKEVSRLAEIFGSFRVFNPQVELMRVPSEEVEASVLAPTGANLAPYLVWLAENHEDRFYALEQDAKDMIPGLEGLHFDDIGGSRPGIILSLVESGLNSPTNLGDASFGTLRVLALLALLYDPDPPPLTCIEEIDHGLHPHLFDRLVERVREASSKTQFLIATHSPAFVNRLDPHELIVCERADDGASRIPAIASSRVEAIEQKLNGELGLGEIWFTGTLGGVPD